MFKLDARPVFVHTPGAPYQPGASVIIHASEESGELDVSKHFGRHGVVEYLEYSCGCGQTYPGDPMIAVRFPAGDIEEFWRGEIRSEGGNDG